MALFIQIIVINFEIKRFCVEVAIYNLRICFKKSKVLIREPFFFNILKRSEHSHLEVEILKNV